MGENSKIPRWMIGAKQGGIIVSYRCSECGWSWDKWKGFNYCPNCGLKLEPPEGYEEPGLKEILSNTMRDATEEERESTLDYINSISFSTNINMMDMIDTDKDKHTKYYLRFGDIPIDKISKVHKSDQIIKSEKGVSVWNCVFVNDVPFPILPNNTNETGMADYFYHLLGNKPVYLVTGTELDEKGSVNEPLLGTDIEIVKEYTNDYEYLKTILKR